MATSLACWRTHSARTNVCCATVHCSIVGIWDLPPTRFDTAPPVGRVLVTDGPSFGIYPVCCYMFQYLLLLLGQCHYKWFRSMCMHRFVRVFTIIFMFMNTREESVNHMQVI